MAWKFLFRTKGGHKFFEEKGTSRIAVADDSGPEPDQTEDGVLYLDTDHPIMIGPMEKG